jgi:hypothetical protein
MTKTKAQYRALVGPREAGESGMIQDGKDAVLFVCVCKNDCTVGVLKDVQ